MTLASAPTLRGRAAPILALCAGTALAIPRAAIAQEADATTGVATAGPSGDAIAKARFLDEWGDRAGAVRLLAAHVKARPRDADARIAYGTFLAEEGRYEAAREELAAAHAITATAGEARRLWIQMELHSGHPERAEELATDALAREPQRADILLARARSRVMLRRLADATVDLDRVLVLDPSNEGARDLRRKIRGDSKLRKAFEAEAAREDGVSMAAWLSAIFHAAHAGIHAASLQNAAMPAPEKSTARGTEVLASARALSKRGDTETALRLLAVHLEATPRDTDARTLYGTMLSWEGRYDEARTQLAIVLRAIPGHGDAIRAAMRVELWSDHPERAESFASEALERDVDSIELLLHRARARLARGDLAGSRADIDRILVLERDNEEARDLRERAMGASRVWTVGGSYSFAAFSGGRQPWHEATLQAKRSTPWGSVLVRGYEAWRFDTNDNQFELEAFPKIRDGTYADVAAAFSPSADLYPKYRLQADLYQRLPLGFEASAGYRRLQFDSAVDIFVLSVSKYLGDWLITVRSFMTPGLAGTSVSASGSVRRYFSDGSTYVGLRYGYGLSREELRSVRDIVLLSSNTVGIEGAILTFRRLELGLRFSVSEEARDARDDLWQYDATTSVGYRF